jgi:glycine/D-amino acid oxidase-like deaminating enzyme
MRHDSHGYWIEEAGSAPEAPAASGNLDFDVLVVGGGYTGMWTAWTISELEPGARIGLVEADVCGHGPSGRNGGFANTMWLSIRGLAERYGDEPAVEVARAAEAAVDAIEAFCDEQEVDAWFRRGGYLQVSAAPAQDGVWSEPAAVAARLGAPEAIQEQTPEQVQARCASPRFRGAAFFPASATVQPARLARGLRERLADRENVSVFEHSPVRRLRAGPWGCIAATPGARIRAGSCVLAFGPAGAAPRSPLRPHVTVTSSHIALTEPVPDVLEELGWTGGECITDGRALLHYFRTTPDGRIAFGWGGGKIAWGARLHGETELDSHVVEQVVEDLHSFFPGTEGRAITHAWGGPIDVSPSHIPVVHQIRADRTFAAFGYTGNGVGPSRMVARILASLALDRRDEHSRLALVDPKPVKAPPGLPGWLGGNTIRAALLAKESAEQDGRKAHPVHRAIARIPDLMGFHIGR